MIQVSKNPENTPTVYIQTFLDQLLSDTHLCKKMETVLLFQRDKCPKRSMDFGTLTYTIHYYIVFLSMIVLHCNFLIINKT